MRNLLVLKVVFHPVRPDCRSSLPEQACPIRDVVALLPCDTFEFCGVAFTIQVDLLVVAESRIYLEPLLGAFFHLFHRFLTLFLLASLDTFKVLIDFMHRLKTYKKGQNLRWLFLSRFCRFSSSTVLHAWQRSSLVVPFF